MPIHNKPIRVKLHLNNTHTACFELDTGSYVSTIRLHDACAAGATVHNTHERALA